MRNAEHLTPGIATILFAISVCTPTSGAPRSSAQSSTRSARASAAAFCAQVQAKAQPLVKPALVLYSATDGSTDDLHRGESDYVDCDFRPPNAQIDISLREDTDGHFSDATKPGYAPLLGFGDKGRYVTHDQSGMRWVDIARGKVACEARLTIADAQLNGEWKQVAGRLCEAAFAAR